MRLPTWQERRKHSVKLMSLLLVSTKCCKLIRYAILGLTASSHVHNWRSKSLRRTIGHCLERDPASRFQEDYFCSSVIRLPIHRLRGLFPQEFAGWWYQNDLILVKVTVLKQSENTHDEIFVYLSLVSNGDDGCNDYLIGKGSFAWENSWPLRIGRRFDADWEPVLSTQKYFFQGILMNLERIY